MNLKNQRQRNKQQQIYRIPKNKMMMDFQILNRLGENILVQSMKNPQKKERGHLKTADQKVQKRIVQADLQKRAHLKMIPLEKVQIIC